MRFSRPALLVSCLLLANCATLTRTKPVPLAITSNPTGAKVVVSNPAGKVLHEGNTPTSVILPASAGPYKAASYSLAFSKKGYAPKTMVLKAGVNPWYAGNIPMPGGSVGLLIIDPLTGAMWKLDDKICGDLKR
jgi:hypothetical protein